MANIAILMASATQAEHGFEMMKCSETLSIKSKVLALINNFLKQDFSICGGEALRAVIHLAILEVSDHESRSLLFYTLYPNSGFGVRLRVFSPI